MRVWDLWAEGAGFRLRARRKVFTRVQVLVEYCTVCLGFRVNFQVQQ